MSATRSRRPPRLRPRLPARPQWRRPGRGLRRRGRPRRRPSPRALAILAGVLAALGLGFLWFRDSSLVSVNRVEVTGLSGPSVARIRDALLHSALTMTTLDVDVAQLRRAVGLYPDVRALTVSSQFPHGLVIHVDEEIPVAAVTIGGRRWAVDGAGSVLRAPVRSDGRLPTVTAGPGDAPGGRLTDSGERAALAVLGAGPFRLLAHVASAAYTSGHGVVVKLRNGPNLLFGTRTQLRAKWDAAVAVLGASSSAGASYIDVSDPARPAAGPSGTSPGATGSSTTASASTLG